ncbi:hypothetical protein B0H16DRAFT_1468664 [Mycena metata]|uniref:Uncharacterized protein n=1 Tax=Mycena metata TaxID=1033252 RepID=A0AAD7I1X9_9AGAR|nr:hypothetical protein B0H16DRAFT_1468664 [Mycena metata]
MPCAEPSATPPQSDLQKASSFAPVNLNQASSFRGSPTLFDHSPYLKQTASSMAERDSQAWERVVLSTGQVQYRWLICNDLRPREQRRIAAHEQTDGHKEALQQHQDTHTASTDPPETPAQLPLAAFVADGLHSLLDSLAAPARYSESQQTSSMNYIPSPQSQCPPPIIDWGLSDNTELEVSPESRAVAQIAQQLSQYLSKDPDSDEELEERSDDGGDQDVEEPTVAAELRGTTYTTKVPSRRQQMAGLPHNQLRRNVSTSGGYMAARALGRPSGVTG